MNKILFRAEEGRLPECKKMAGIYIRETLSLLGIDNWELSVLFCGNKYIKELNSQYLNKDEATDVLSFPNGGTFPVNGRVPAGDIVISLDALEENAFFFNVTEDEELARLLVHGILHLTGADHKTNRKSEPMLRQQEMILEKLTGIKTAPSGTCPCGKRAG